MYENNFLSECDKYFKILKDPNIAIHLYFEARENNLTFKEVMNQHYLNLLYESELGIPYIISPTRPINTPRIDDLPKVM